MRAHDVRSLRYCDTCKVLGWRDAFLSDAKKVPSQCIACAYKAAGTIDAFMAAHPRKEWDKLPLDLIGADAMRRLLREVEG
jgi:fructose-1,6-bisphosphatase/inositol monophosphatase family enzyme